jgi:DNA invertase Pin-like site-specific DNA recombinase
MTLKGYGRVSTRDQNPDYQHDALLAAGCAEGDIHIDHGKSGKLARRPALDECLAALQPGDTLVITRLSRLARSLTNLLALASDFRERNITLKTLDQGDVDMTTPTGRFVLNILGAVDEFQREIIVENTYEGLAAAKARGRVGGRKPGLDPRRVAAARQLVDNGASVAEVAQTLKVSRATVYRHLEASAQSPG